MSSTRGTSPAIFPSVGPSEGDNSTANKASKRTINDATDLTASVGADSTTLGVSKRILVHEICRFKISSENTTDPYTAEQLILAFGESTEEQDVGGDGCAHGN